MVIEARITLSACNANANGQRGFYNDSAVVSYEGCISRSNTNDGISVDNVNCAITGCTSYGNGGNDYAATERVAFVGNTLEVGATVQPSSLVSYDNVGIESLGNVGGNFRTLSVVNQMGNSTSSTMTGGLVVTHASVASGEAYGTTTTAGDDKVAGMTLGTTGANEYGRVLSEGYTTRLRVDGTTDIAIGDFLGTFTTAGIAAKVTSGMAFAIALEAYTSNDSNGEIDALLIKPRKIGSSSGGTSNLARAYRSATQSINSGSSTKVELNNESYDTGSDFDSATNYRYTAPSTGYYHMNAAARIVDLGDGKFFVAQIKKNGTTTLCTSVSDSGHANSNISAYISDVQSLTAGDYIELFVEHDHGSARDLHGNGDQVFMSISLVGT